VAHAKILIRESGRQSAPSFIANAHNKLYCLLYGKRQLFEKNYEPVGGAAQYTAISAVV